MLRPPRLRRGDTVALLSLSWGGPHAFPHVYERGVEELRQRFGLEVREYPTTRADPIHLLKHPEERARDLLAALGDPGIRGVFSTIGGDDSCRLLPLLSPACFRQDPKILLGFSDTTPLLTASALAGVVSLHGPSIMAGFSQLAALPAAATEHLREMLFEPGDRYVYRPFGEWSDGYPRWEDPANTGKVHPSHQNMGPHWLQGKEPVSGALFGGCLEVLEFLKGTPYWPPAEFWTGKILFLETSEGAPSPVQVRWTLRNYGLMGALAGLRAVLVGRAARYSEPQKEELDGVLRDVIAGEFQRPDLPIVSDLDFGHTDPQWVLPLGVRATVDPSTRSIRLDEPWLS